jgi:predicted ATPase
MITRLDVENFKCLREVSVELGPLTVLIGANDSGKSSILDAIRVVGRSASEPIAASLAQEDGEGFDALVWRREVERDIALCVTGKAGASAFEYGVTIGRGPSVVSDRLLVDGQPTPWSNVQGLDVSGGPGTRTSIAFHLKNSPALRRDPRFAVVAAFASTQKYHLEPRALREVRPFQSAPMLSSSGDNLPEALDALITGPNRSAIQHLESALHAAVPTLSGVALRTVEASGTNRIGKALEFILAGTTPPITIPAGTASEGALLLTAYLVLAYGETPEILLIEEPENGLHPTRLEAVIDLLRKISTGAVGNRPRQVIMTTHSPLLLNYVAPDDVRICRRDPEGGTQVTPMRAVPDLDRMLREFAVGELEYVVRSFRDREARVGEARDRGRV